MNHEIGFRLWLDFTLPKLQLCCTGGVYMLLPRSQSLEFWMKFREKFPLALVDARFRGLGVGPYGPFGECDELFEWAIAWRDALKKTLEET